MKRSKESILKQQRTRIERGLNKGTDRQSLAFRNWGNAIKQRDNYKCTRCDETKFLHPHHIKPWKYYPELRFDIDNGITLCASCHAKEEGFQKGHSIGKGRKFTTEHIEKLRLAKLGKPSHKKGKKTGKPAWNSGLKTGKVAWNSGKKGVQVAWNKGRKLSPEQNARFTEWKKGRKLTEEHKIKLRGRIPWNKGLKTNKPSWNSGKKGLQIAWNKGKKKIIDPITNKRKWILD